MRIPSCLALFLLLSACATQVNESIKKRDTEWPPLTMTQTELIHTLGKPATRSAVVVDGNPLTTLTWSLPKTETNPALFAPIAGPFLAGRGHGVSGDSRTLSAVFSDEKMVSRSWSEHKIGK